MSDEFQTSDKNNDPEEPVSERNYCDHKQAGEGCTDTVGKLQSLFTHMNPSGTVLSGEDRMDALSKLNGNKDDK